MPAFYFDVGGVIIPSTPSAREVFEHLADHYETDPQDAYRTFVAMQRDLDVGAVRTAEFCAAIKVKNRDAYEAELWRFIGRIPETIAIIERLLQRGDKVGLATAFTREWLERVIDLTPVLRRTTICCSSEVGVTKPDRAFFAKAQELIGSTDIVFVDDQPANVHAARSFGWTAILADDGWQDRFTARYLRPGC
jgi:HAD superfamily hydrolase (TIGR01509 family)